MSSFLRNWNKVQPVMRRVGQNVAYDAGGQWLGDGGPTPKTGLPDLPYELGKALLNYAMQGPATQKQFYTNTKGEPHIQPQNTVSVAEDPGTAAQVSHLIDDGVFLEVCGSRMRDEKTNDHLVKLSDGKFEVAGLKNPFNPE
jgi:hypothetical protein